VPVYIVGTGHPIPPQAREFCGTVVMDRYVWHIWLG
jgi:hypothetical protein